MVCSWPAGMSLQFTKVYIIIGGTFLLGALTLLYALRYKKEVIVFRDRALEASHWHSRTPITLEKPPSAWKVSSQR